MSEMESLAFLFFIILFLYIAFLYKKIQGSENQKLDTRFLIEQLTFAKRRTAKRAGTRKLQQIGGWMFEESGKNGKWE